MESALTLINQYFVGKIKVLFTLRAQLDCIEAEHFDSDTITGVNQYVIQAKCVTFSPQAHF